MSKNPPAPDKSESKAPAEVARIAASKHKWRDDGNKLRDTTPSGCDEHERTCEFCGLVKITVHKPEGFPYRAFRSKGGVRFPDPGYTPVCDGGET
ncbi:MAG TPA: hypothetical protein VNH44_07010 [Micropepsaceae bacterium]|nr:hypothetical protein [Micropepsaceae bacterium]